jgi:hypothetical protein
MALIETTPVKEDYRRRMAYQLMKEASDANTPVLHWAQGLAKLGQGALGGYQMYQADQKDKETESGNNAALIAALQGGGGAPVAPSAQPTPQRPTAQPMPPVSSVTPSAGAVPAALMGGRPGGPVMPSNKVWGDAEAEAAGLYEKPAPGPKIAANGPVALPPQPAAPAAVPAPAAPPPVAAVPSPTEPQMADAKARIAAMLQSDNPQMRKLGQGMAQAMIAKQLAGKEDPQYEYKERPDGSLIAVDKKNPANFKVVPAPGGGQDAINYEANKARALQGVNREGTAQYEAEKAAAIEKAKALATREIAKPEQDKQNQKVGTIVTQDIDRAISKIDSGILPTTGGAGNLLASVPGTQAHDVNKLLETVKSNSGFQELAKMRAASPTGAALGSVTERELALLQSTIGNLEQSQSGDQLKDNLRRVKNTYMDIIHGEGKGPEREKLTFQEKGGPIKIDGYTIKAR